MPITCGRRILLAGCPRRAQPGCRIAGLGAPWALWSEMIHTGAWAFVLKEEAGGPLGFTFFHSFYKVS